ncbi:MAG TPA: hypothetical protein VGH02_07515 [Rhizomicrobium sp.]|jgi:hypothetical protein
MSAISGRALWGIVLPFLLSTSALAGPPFATDDPEPTAYRSLEIYMYSEGTHTDSDTSGTLAGLEVNYGAAPNLQLTVAVPFAYDKGAGRGTLFGYGATEFGAKYRFIQEDDSGWRPQVSFYPSVEIPIDSDRPAGVGGGHARYFLPLWLQKSYGPWTTFGGGGYWINPGSGDRNYWFMGWALQRQITSNFSIGTEIFHQTRDTLGGEISTGVNVGAIYDINDRWHLVGSVGTGVQNARQTDESTYYFAIEWTPSLDSNK